mmetsp:Transcript_12233/g.20290  ORF Transcript_12233/g.20290 Transcript_12233/m.20290 type:complete len:349 (+) Transcript_12233:506-1552(+)
MVLWLLLRYPHLHRKQPCSIHNHSCPSPDCLKVTERPQGQPRTPPRPPTSRPPAGAPPPGNNLPLPTRLQPPPPRPPTPTYSSSSSSSRRIQDRSGWASRCRHCQARSSRMRPTRRTAAATDSAAVVKKAVLRTQSLLLLVATLGEQEKKGKQERLIPTMNFQTCVEVAVVATRVNWLLTLVPAVVAVLAHTLRPTCCTPSYFHPSSLKPLLLLRSSVEAQAAVSSSTSTSARCQENSSRPPWTPTTHSKNCSHPCRLRRCTPLLLLVLRTNMAVVVMEVVVTERESTGSMVGETAAAAGGTSSIPPCCCTPCPQRSLSAPCPASPPSPPSRAPCSTTSPRASGSWRG